jgi:hypothetical protein
MKKVIYLLGALVITLNLLFSITFENNASMDTANANPNEDCSVLQGKYEWFGYREVEGSACEDGEGNPCGTANSCTPQDEYLCGARTCEIWIG